MTDTQQKQKKKPPVPKFNLGQVETQAKQEKLQEFLLELKGEEKPIIQQQQIPQSEKNLQIPPISPKPKQQIPTASPTNLQNMNDKINELFKKKISNTTSVSATQINPETALKQQQQQQQQQQTRKNLLQQMHSMQNSNPSMAQNIKKQEYLKSKEEYDPAKPNDYDQIVQEVHKQWEIKKIMQQVGSDKMEIEESPKLSKEKSSSKSHALQQQQPKSLENINKHLENLLPTMQKQNLFQTENSHYYEQQPTQETNQMVLEDNKASGGGDSQEEKILKMMEKQGYKLGQGLGKQKQGITAPIIPVKMSSTTANLQQSQIGIEGILSEDLVMKKYFENQNIKPTKILLLQNMATKQEADDDLRQDVQDECSIHGKVLQCLIFILNNVPEDQQVRIFVEFDKTESAIKAYMALQNRFFGGRVVNCSFYNETSYLKKQLDLKT